MTKNRLLTIVGVLLVVWVLFAVIGLVVKGLIWLFVIGLILLTVTAVLGGVRSRR